MNKTEIINFLIDKLKYKTYLEINIFQEENFDLINIEKKILVNSCLDGIYGKNVNFYLNSNEFFKNNFDCFDFILIDGFHDSDIIDVEIEECLLRLNNNGLIMLHDSNPNNYELQITPCQKLPWTGDVWRFVTKLKNKKNIQYFTIDSDCGCTIIKKSNQSENSNQQINTNIDWHYFENNKKELLNLISVDEFKNKFI